MSARYWLGWSAVMFGVGSLVGALCSAHYILSEQRREMNRIFGWPG